MPFGVVIASLPEPQILKICSENGQPHWRKFHELHQVQAAKTADTVQMDEMVVGISGRKCQWGTLDARAQFGKNEKAERRG